MFSIFINKIYSLIEMQSESPISGISTLNARKGYKRNRQLRQSSLPKSFEMDSGKPI